MSFFFLNEHEMSRRLALVVVLNVNFYPFLGFLRPNTGAGPLQLQCTA